MQSSDAAARHDELGEAFDPGVDLSVRHLSDRTNLSGSAALLLNRVYREGPTRLTTLATLEGVSQPSMTQLIQRMERQGLLERHRDPDDGRAVLIGVTEEGQELFRARKRHRRARLDELMAGLPAEDRETLLRCARDVEPILGRLMERAESARRDECEGHQAGGAR